MFIEPFQQVPRSTFLARSMRRRCPGQERWWRKKGMIMTLLEIQCYGNRGSYMSDDLIWYLLNELNEFIWNEPLASFLWTQSTSLINIIKSSQMLILFSERFQHHLLGNVGPHCVFSVTQIQESVLTVNRTACLHICCSA